MCGALPQWIEVERLAEKGERMEGVFAVAALERLREMGVAPDGDVSFALVFFSDDRGRARVAVTIKASVLLVCQRCLQAVRHELSGGAELMALADESALLQLPDDVEPLLTGGRPVRLVELVEDEALLALPIVAMHPQCALPAHDKSAEDANPFAVLKRKE